MTRPKQIYKIVNTVNDKVYIGITTRLLCQRWGDHCCMARKGLRDTKLYRAMRKHGIENFKAETLEIVNTVDELNQKEIAYIAEYNSIKNGYNTLAGGDCPQHTPETIKKLKAYIKTEDHRKKLSDGQSGKTLSSEHMANIVIANRKRCIPVLQYTLHGELIQTWESSRDAERAGIAFNTNITKACKRHKTSGGFLWRFTTDPIKTAYLFFEYLLLSISKDSGYIGVYDSFTGAMTATGLSRSVIRNSLLKGGNAAQNPEKNFFHWVYNGKVASYGKSCRV